MALPKHLEEAVTRLTEASFRVEQAREKPFTPDAQKEWLVALTDYAYALSDIQEYNNESVHEKLHEVAARGSEKIPITRGERGITVHARTA